MKSKDKKLLKKAVEELKKVKGVISIAQTGSSLKSEDYNDIDLIVFYETFLPPPAIKRIKKKYKRTKISIQDKSCSQKYKIIGGMKLFIKFFKRDKKKFLYGEDPFKNFEPKINPLDVAHFIWYMHHIPDSYDTNYESALSASLNAMLAYKEIFPQNKYEILPQFKEKYPELYNFLPKNPEKHLKEIKRNEFKKFYIFLEKCIESFMKNKTTLKVA